MAKDGFTNVTLIKLIKLAASQTPEAFVPNLDTLGSFTFRRANREIRKRTRKGARILRTLQAAATQHILEASLDGRP